MKQVILYKWNLLWRYRAIESFAHFAYLFCLCKFDYLHWNYVLSFAIVDQAISLIRPIYSFKRGDISVGGLIGAIFGSCIKYFLTGGYWYVIT